MSSSQQAIDEEIKRQEEMLLAKKVGPKKPLIQKDHKYFDSIEMCKQKGLQSPAENVEEDDDTAQQHKTLAGKD